MESSKTDFSTFDALREFLINSPVIPPILAEPIIIYLFLIKEIIIDPPQEFVENGSLQEAKSVVTKVGSIFSSFDLNKMNQYMAFELCMQLYYFFELDKNLNYFQRFYEEKLELPPSCYPKTSKFVFIHHLLENLDELLKDTASSTLPFNYVILTVQRELHLWYSDLVEISSNPPLFLKEVIGTITKLAYDLDYALDSFIVGDVPSWRFIFWLREILLQFQQIEQEREYGEEENLNATINDMLLGGDEQLNMITIYNPPGKAFDKELYNHPSVINHFDSRLYCFLDILDERKTLLDLLGHLVDLSDIIHSKNNEELTKLVYESLEGQRYLVMIDDVWTFKQWIKIRRCFPDSQKGSRIVITTCIREFSFTAKSKSIVQPQYPQNGKIWEELFQLVSCPNEMFEVRMKIAKRCKPESRSRVVHHLLHTIQKTVNKWEEVAQTLGSRIFGLKGSQVNRILDLICIYLPDHLRSCLFYLGVFLHEREILVSKLIRFWIAEGFVKQTEYQSLENTAEDYLSDLLARNLLVSTKEKTLGRAKTCDLIRVVGDFLYTKVKEDNFLQTQSSKDMDSSSEESSEDPDSSSSSTIYYQRRLLIRSKWDEFAMLKPSGPFVHSLFYFTWEWEDIYDISHDILFLYNNFKFLRILDMEYINIGDSFIEVGVLVLLRYLAVQSSVNFIPPSIANLEYLETFIYNQPNFEVVRVPDCIWDMSKLRHVHIQSYSSFDLEPHGFEKSSSILDNLQTFSKPILAYGDDMEKILRRLKSIQKLYCVFLDSWDDSTKCNRFPRLEFLNNLISLKVDYKGEGKYPCEFNFPSNLKKLTLENFQMPWNEFLQLQILNNLEVLNLSFNAFEGERWEMEKHVAFPKLKHLKLRCIEVVEYWSATHDQFPRLEHLVVERCKKLVEIPQDFAYITSIHMIEVLYCTPSAENSARLIQEQHLKCWGYDKLKISCKSE